MFSYFRSPDEMMDAQEPDALPIQTDELCPFCGRLIEWSGHVLYCEPCRRVWPTFSDLRMDQGMQKYLARKAAAQAVAL